MNSDQLFSENELVQMAQQVLLNPETAVSDLCTWQQFDYIDKNFGYNHSVHYSYNYSEVMSLFLLFINEYIKTDGETI